MGQLAQAAQGRNLAPARSTAIEFVDDTGNMITVSSSDVLQYICPNATPKEVVFFMELCRSQKLNPFRNEAYLVKFKGSPAQMITAEIVFERRANAHPDFEGMEHGVVYLDASGNIQKREGTATYSEAGERLIGGWCRVHRKGRSDSYSEVSLKEYNKNQSVWKTMPGVMIDKCAKGTALRAAFPSDFEGMYLEEETSKAPDVIQVAATVLPDNSNTEKLNGIVAELAALRNQDTDTVMNAIADSGPVKATGYIGGPMSSIQTEIAIKQAERWLDRAKSAQQPEYDTEAAPVGVDPETGEIAQESAESASDGIEIADEDQPWPEA